jgi:hypothetical protein
MDPIDRQEVLEQVMTQIGTLRERIAFLVDGSGILRCPLGQPGVSLIVERAEWPSTGKLTAVFYDGPDMTSEAAWAADIAERLRIPLERPDNLRLLQPNREDTTRSGRRGPDPHLGRDEPGRGS